MPRAARITSGESSPRLRRAIDCKPGNGQGLTSGTMLSLPRPAASTAQDSSLNKQEGQMETKLAALD